VRALPQRTRFRYTNEAVGLFVLAALVLFIAGLFYSGYVRKWFNPGEKLRVVLPEDGLFGLARGSVVEIIGTKAGEVIDIVINPNEKMHADVRIESDMTPFIRSDSVAVIRKTFGIAGDSYLEITRGKGKPLDWEYAVITAVSDRKPTESVGDMIDELREKLFPIIDDTHRGIKAFLAVIEELQDPDKGVQQLLANLNALTEGITQGKGTIGRLLNEDKLIREAENLVVQLNTSIAQLTPIIDDLKITAQNTSEFAEQINAQSEVVPQITQSLEDSVASAEIIMKNLSQAAPQMPRIARNIGDASDSAPVMLLQMQQLLVELDRLTKQLQSNWLLGGKGGIAAPPPARISPLEVRP